MEYGVCIGRPRSARLRWLKDVLFGVEIPDSDFREQNKLEREIREQKKERTNSSQRTDDLFTLTQILCTLELTRRSMNSIQLIHSTVRPYRHSLLRQVQRKKMGRSTVVKGKSKNDNLKFSEQCQVPRQNYVSAHGNRTIFIYFLFGSGPRSSGLDKVIFSI
jgi:hypothetical protein